MFDPASPGADGSDRDSVAGGELVGLGVSEEIRIWGKNFDRIKTEFGCLLDG